MSARISRRMFVAALASNVALPACANPPATSLRPAARGEDLRLLDLDPLDTLVNSAGLGERADIAFVVADASNGKVLESRLPAKGLPPASTTKAITAAYALDVLGSQHRFATRLIATGGVADGIVAGDLVLAGGGDPTLDTDALAAMAGQLKAAGIREVRGDFLVWGGALPYVREIDATQPDHVGYNPAISGLNLNYNRVHFEWRRAGGDWAVTMDARSANHRPDVQVARMQLAERSTPVYTYADRQGRDEWTVARGALGKGGARWLPVRKPELYAGEVFRTFARSHGIVLGAPKVTRSAPSGAKLVTHRSEPLTDILSDMLRFSTNITAEVVGLSATAKRTGGAASLKASAREMGRWAQARLGASGLTFVDHSGLGDKSRVKAGDMTSAMIAAQGLGLTPLLKLIRYKDFDAPVRAKTGTLNFVSALSGFIDVPDGRRLCFTILTGDISRRAGLGEADRERPRGSRGWNTRSKTLQQRLLERWGILYSS